MTVFLLCDIINLLISDREARILNTSCEYIVKQKNEGKALAKKIVAVFSYALLAAILIGLIVSLSPIYFVVPFLIIAAAFVAIIIFVSWRFLCIEYEIVIAGGDLMITTVYGRSIRKRTINIGVTSIIEIGEYGDGAFEEISKLSLQKNYLCISSLSSPNMYYAIFDEDKDRAILYFDATADAITLLRKYNPGAFKASEKRMNK